MLSRPRQESKHEQIIRRARTKAYDVFVKVGGVTSLDELVLPCPGQPGSDPSDDEGSSCWVWLVNLGENGGFFQEKKTEVEQVFLSRDPGSVWVPLVGKVSSTAPRWTILPSLTRSPFVPPHSSPSRSFGSRHPPSPLKVFALIRRLSDRPLLLPPRSRCLSSSPAQTSRSPCSPPRRISTNRREPSSLSQANDDGHAMSRCGTTSSRGRRSRC